MCVVRVGAGVGAPHAAHDEGGADAAREDHVRGHATPVELGDHVGGEAVPVDAVAGVVGDVQGTDHTGTVGVVLAVRGGVGGVTDPPIRRLVPVGERVVDLGTELSE